MLTAGFGKIQYFLVECSGNILAECFKVSVIIVCQSVSNGQGTRHGDLDRMLRGLLGTFPVLGEEKVSGVNWTANRRQFGRVITCPNLPFGETDKVDVFQMSAMVVDIIFPGYFSISGNIDACIHLIQNRLPGSSIENFNGFLSH